KRCRSARHRSSLHPSEWLLSHYGSRAREQRAHAFPEQPHERVERIAERRIAERIEGDAVRTAHQVIQDRRSNWHVGASDSVRAYPSGPSKSAARPPLLPAAGCQHFPTTRPLQKIAPPTY